MSEEVQTDRQTERQNHYTRSRRISVILNFYHKNPENFQTTFLQPSFSDFPQATYSSVEGFTWDYFPEMVTSMSAMFHCYTRTLNSVTGSGHVIYIRSSHSQSAELKGLIYKNLTLFHWLSLQNGLRKQMLHSLSRFTLQIQNTTKIHQSVFPCPINFSYLNIVNFLKRLFQ